MNHPPTQEKDGEDLPTAKGVALSVAQWRALSGALDQLIAAQMRADTGFTLQLSDARKAYTSEFKWVQVYGERVAVRGGGVW